MLKRVLTTAMIGALASVLALGAVACGGDDDDEDAVACGGDDDDEDDAEVTPAATAGLDDRFGAKAVEMV